MFRKLICPLFVFLTLTFTVSVGSLAQVQLPTKEAVSRLVKSTDFSPYAGRNYPTQVFWGDTHLHTDVSVDAGTMCRLGQEEAFRFARGEEVTSTGGLQAKLSRPLDWVVVSDHSEMYGIMPYLLAGDECATSSPEGQRWYEMLTSGDEDLAFQAAMEIVASLSDDEPPIDCPQLIQAAWQDYTALADQFNEPGRFSALIGYEWTSEGGDNIHRNVIFRDGASVVNNIIPFSQYESKNPEDLWDAMETYQASYGQVLAIPHNGNLSNGRMFSLNTFDGQPLTLEIAKQRIDLEPLIEATQIKGDGEAHPILSPDDEFADYETWDVSNLDGTEAKEEWMLEFEYARSALKNGLKLEEDLGVNPYKFGMASGTDAHTALATAEEENFFGKHSGVEPEPHRWEHLVIESPDNPDFNVYGWQMAAAGYTGVWATENTREGIFDAMMRKEVYSTTGPRMIVRFFGGWTFDQSDTLSRLPAETGYTKGVPMGGDLSAAPTGESPNFLVAAMKDPYSGNLDRVQIVKGWLDTGGTLHEKVYNVVWGGDRQLDGNGDLPAIGSTVDVANATWTNTIGANELIEVWEDPDFDPEERAFYYVRVLEIPTPRWTAYDAKRFGVVMDPQVPMEAQERAYTSPIWYTPGS